MGGWVGGRGREGEGGGRGGREGVKSDVCRGGKREEQGL